MNVPEVVKLNSSFPAPSQLCLALRIASFLRVDRLQADYEEGRFVHLSKNYVPETVLSTGDSSEQADENLSLPWSLRCKGK